MNHEAIFHPVGDFLEQFGGDQEVCLEITAIARSDMEMRMQELKAVALRGDAEAFARQLHAMRGVIATFGCETLTNFLLESEKNTETAAKVDESSLHEILNAASVFLNALDEFEAAIR